jgi:DNA ligase (NAD+)
MEKNSQRFLELVVLKQGISMKQAVEKMDSCFKQVATDLDVSISQVIKDFYNLLNPRYGVICKELDPGKCTSSNYCTYFKDSCIPIFVKDYELINNDPDGYIESLNTIQLVQLRDLSAHLYYNVGGSGLEDNSFDAIEYHLRKRLKKEHMKIDAIGAIPIDKIRVDLPYPLPSLDKIRPDEKAFTEFLKNAPGKGIIWSDKLDGVSALVVYQNGNPINLYTRGNGTVGGDISYLLEHITFPRDVNEKGLLSVRGELVIRRSKFRDKYRDLYSTARSFVVSQTNKGYVTPSAKDVDFVAYEVVSYGTRELDIKPQKDLSFMALMGFDVVQHGSFAKDVLIIDVTLTYRERREESDYDIDGLVLDHNFARRVATIAQNPEYKKAFKMQFDEQLRTTTVEDVDWDISRYGRYNPVAVYKPVYIDHVRIHRATAHNAAHVRDWNMGVGTVIKVIRAGDVIPQIKDVIINYDIEIIYPNNTYQWYWKSRDIVLSKIESNPRVRQKRILHFLQVVEVAGIGEKTVEKMFAKGFDDIQAILDATPDQLMTVPGIGKITAKKIKDRLCKAMSTTPIDRFLEALTVIDFKVSRKLVKEVLRTFPNILDKQLTTAETLAILKRKKIKGIGVKRLEMISTQFPVFRQLLMKLDSVGVTKAIQYQKELADKLKRDGYNQKIENKIFVFSGFKKPPYDLEDYIFNNMGEVGSSVTSGTTAVIAYTNTIITPKILSARGFNVPIYTHLEFREKMVNL